VKRLIIVLNLLGMCSLALAQSQTQLQAAREVSRSPLTTSTCAFTFTTGANDSFVKYCVTVNGNIAQFESPAGKEHIAIGTIGEGYGFCDLNPQVRYFDYSDFGDSGNWGAPTTVSQTATSVKISRTTTDGIWTLTQTITQIGGVSPSARIKMTVKNNSNITRSLFFMRYADADAGGSFLNNFDGTQKSAFGWNSDTTSNAVGLLLQNAGTFPADSSPGAFTQNVPEGPDPCNFTTHFASGPQLATDGSIVLLYALNFSKGASRTVTVSYEGL
jgi:hypothetical protein